MKKFFLLFFLLGVSFTSAQHHSNLNGDDALKKLIEGNERFKSSNPTYPNQSANYRSELTKGQNPFAIIVSCSDSRVAPEIIFDQGLGDLFVIRIAGNVVDDLAIGSIEYAVEHLGTPLIIVLGHDKCGAVTAAVQGGYAGAHIQSIINAIRPAVDYVRNIEGNLIENSIDENVRRVVSQLKSSEPLLKELVDHKKIKISGAVYRFNSGKVDFMQ